MDDNELPAMPSSVAGYASQLARYCALAIGGALVSRGMISGDTNLAIAGLAGTAAPVVLGLILGRLTRKKLSKAIAIAKDNAVTSTNG